MQTRTAKPPLVRSLPAVLLIATAPLARPVAGPATAADDLGAARQSKILFAGFPGGEREQRFLAFLKPWFAQVDAISLKELDAKRAAPYDVVIADWKRFYADGAPGNEDRSGATLSRDFGKPILMLSAVAGEIQHHVSKIGWL